MDYNIFNIYFKDCLLLILLSKFRGLDDVQSLLETFSKFDTHDLRELLGEIDPLATPEFYEKRS